MRETLVFRKGLWRDFPNVQLNHVTLKLEFKHHTIQNGVIRAEACPPLSKEVYDFEISTMSVSGIFRDQITPECVLFNKGVN